ncbi:MAG TPA: hypothetical protein EYH34_14195 [Planctomycetes bacterium]|nr:hypothetical protein [Planctomycetota bacterium]
MAIGTYGPRERVWFAMVSLPKAGRDAKVDVRVFHTATQRWGSAGRYFSDDAQRLHRVLWLEEFSSAEGVRLLLVGRGRPAGEWVTATRPLVVDLESLTVSVFAVRFPVAVRGINVCPGGDHAVVPGWPEPRIVCLEQQKPHTADTRPPPPETDPASRLTAILLRYQGMIYQTGNPWHRVDPRTCRIEEVKSSGVPYTELFERYAVSAHYGLVAWNRGSRLYRVVIESVPADDPDGLYPFVPQSDRRGHHRAVQTLRALGASVDTRWGYCRQAVDGKTGRPSDPDRYEWRTIVYLPKAWKGGDAGLEHLADLHNLRDLYLVQAPISDQGLRTIGRMRGLESLYVVETKATSAGLVHLRNLHRLAFLRLEGRRQGPHFDSAGLESLGPLANLQRLTLYGAGFGEEVLAVLSQFPKLKTVNLLDVNVTESEAERLRKSKRPRVLLWRPGLAGWLFD